MANYAPEGEPLEGRPTRPDAYPRNVSEFGVRDLAGNFADGASSAADTDGSII